MSFATAGSPQGSASILGMKPHADVFATGAATADAPDKFADGDLRLAQLLCSRLCHDLIGAAGAISNGVELLADEAADNADIHDLIRLSGRQLNRRLAFYRQAFAMSGSQGPASSLEEARRLAVAFLDGGRVTLHWSVDGPGTVGDDISAALLRLVLCAVLVASEGLGRGGMISVRIEGGSSGTTVRIDGEGRGADLPSAVRVALDPETAPEAITARTVPAYYLGQLARQLKARVEVVDRDGSFCLRIG